MFELVAITAPFILGIILVGLGHDITDPTIAKELENERQAN